MMNRRKLAAMAAASALLTVSVPSFADDAKPAPANEAAGSQDAVTEARTRYNRGIELYNDGDYKLAIIEFQRSYDLAPNWRVLYNIGEVQFQLNNYASALKSLERYLAEGGTEIPDKRKAEVLKDIDSLRVRTGFLTVKTNVEGADVMVDEVPIGKSPLAPDLLVDGGSRKVVVSKVGYRTESKNVTVAGKDHITVTVDLTEEPKFQVGGGQIDRTSYVWLGWAATGVFATGAVVTGILAMDAQSKLDDMRSQRNVTRADLDDQDTKRGSLALASDILVGATVVAAGVSLYFTLTGSHKESTAKASSVRAGVGPGSLFLNGTF